MDVAPGDITLLLGRWSAGDSEALELLMPMVYPHLREVAAAYVRRERRPGVMQATMLVHELYLRLVNQNTSNLSDREHFYTFSAKMMRHILIDHARESQSLKRGGGLDHLPLSDDLPWIEIGSPEILQLGMALDELVTIDPYKVKLVELRYFLGCTAEETAELAGVSKATVDRDLKFVRTWLYRKLYPGSELPGIAPTPA